MMNSFSPYSKMGAGGTGNKVKFEDNSKYENFLEVDVKVSEK